MTGEATDYVYQATTYKQAAENILATLQGYEDAHPAGEPCFKFALEECEKRYAQVYSGDSE